MHPAVGAGGERFAVPPSLSASPHPAQDLLGQAWKDLGKIKDAVKGWRSRSRAGEAEAKRKG